MADEKFFSKKEALKYGWEQTKNHLGFFIGVFVVIWVLSVAPGMVADQIGDQFPTTSLLLMILGIVLSMLVEMGLKRIGIDFVDEAKSKLSHLVSQYPLFLPYLGGSILYALITLGGLILLIIPGIIWAIKFQFFGYFIIDKEIGVKESLKKSSKITEDTKWDLFLFNVLLMLINIGGAILFGIGLILTVPTTTIAMAHVYRKLSKRAK